MISIKHIHTTSLFAYKYTATFKLSPRAERAHSFNINAKTHTDQNHALDNHKELI